jgi:hypothetical protein
MTTPGDTNPMLRKCIIDYVVSRTLDQVSHPNIPEEAVLILVDKITFASYSIEDEDLIMLRSLGWSDDAIYEIILSAAYGAGLARMQTLYSLLNETNENEA